MPCTARRISSWLAVDAITSSTGKTPALGSADGRNTGARTPVMPDVLPYSSPWMPKMFRFRSSQGFTIIPPKPPEANVIWKE